MGGLERKRKGDRVAALHEVRVVVVAMPKRGTIEEKRGYSWWHK